MMINNSIQALIDEHRNINKPQYGSFPERPPEAKSLNSWLQEGRKPISLDRMQMFRMMKNNQGYGYFFPHDTIEMTDLEKAEYAQITSSYASRRQSSQAHKPKPQKKPQQTQAFTQSPQRQQPATTTSNTTKSQKDTKPKKPKKLNFGIPEVLLSQDANILVFDCETTGFSPKRGDELLQLSMVQNGKEVFNSYLKPHHQTSWVGAMRVNHISPKMVKNAPYPEYVKDYVQKLFDQADYIVGHNVGFDLEFVTDCMGITIDKTKVLDTLDFYNHAHPDFQSHKLESAVEFYQVDSLTQYQSGAHDALVDTIATYEVFLKQLKEERERRAPKSNDLFSEITNMQFPNASQTPDMQQLQEENRLLVLPVALGAEVYTIRSAGGHPVVQSEPFRVEMLSRMDDTVFVQLEDAERKLHELLGYDEPNEVMVL